MRVVVEGVGVASVVPFLKSEFNDAGYRDEGENGIDSDVGGEDNGCSKSNGMIGDT